MLTWYDFSGYQTGWEKMTPHLAEPINGSWERQREARAESGVAAGVGEADSRQSLKLLLEQRLGTVQTAWSASRDQRNPLPSRQTICKVHTHTHTHPHTRLR